MLSLWWPHFCGHNPGRVLLPCPAKLRGRILRWIPSACEPPQEEKDGEVYHNNHLHLALLWDGRLPALTSAVSFPAPVGMRPWLIQGLTTPRHPVQVRYFDYLSSETSWLSWLRIDIRYWRCSPRHRRMLLSPPVPSGVAPSLAWTTPETCDKVERRHPSLTISSSVALQWFKPWDILGEGYLSESQK